MLISIENLANAFTKRQLRKRSSVGEREEKIAQLITARIYEQFIEVLAKNSTTLTCALLRAFSSAYNNLFSLEKPLLMLIIRKYRMKSKIKFFKIYEFFCWHFQLFSTSCFGYRGQKNFIPDLDELRSLDAKFIAVTLRHVKNEIHNHNFSTYK